MSNLSPTMRRLLAQIARGDDAQTGPERPGEMRGIGFAVLAPRLAERGLVRLVRRRNHTRVYVLTPAGKAELAAIAKEES